MFKKIALSLVLALGIGTSLNAHAVSSSAAFAQWIVNVNGNISTTSPSPLITSTTKAVKGISVLNTTERAVVIAIGLSGSASSGDVNQIVVPSNSTGSPIPTYYPLVVSQGVRISVRAVGIAATSTGSQVQLNAFYN